MYFLLHFLQDRVIFFSAVSIDITVVYSEANRETLEWHCGKRQLACKMAGDLFTISLPSRMIKNYF